MPVILTQSVTSKYPWLDHINPEKALFKGRAYRVAKRVMDLTLCLLAAPLLGPLLLFCALAIKLESPKDPIWFKQIRTGKGGRPFRMYKFRTMVVNADEIKKQLMHLNELQWPDFKITNDPRITKVGRILRKTSLDEFPQLLNVVTGDMSLVGPRPTSFSVETYQLWHTERLDVSPGLTGLWQITERANSEFDERLRLDIAYIERRCLWLDFLIIIHTIPVIFVTH